MRPEFNQILAIASVTFREVLREKILWSTIVFALFLTALSLAVAQLSIYEPGRIAMDFGAATVGLAGGLLAVIVGGSLISREVKERTLYLVLTKSIWRWQFVVGKFAGLVAVIFLNSAIMYAILGAVCAFLGAKPHVNLLYNAVMQYSEFLMLAAVGVFFSCFTTSMLAGIFAACLWVIGHAMDDVRLAFERIPAEAIRRGAGFLLRFLPDFTVFDIKAQLSHGVPVSLSQVASAVLYAGVFAFFMVSAGCLLFSKRDL